MYPEWIRPIGALLVAVTLGILAAPYLPLPPILFPILAATILGAGLFLLSSHVRIAFVLFALAFGLFGVARARQVMTPLPNDVSRWNDSSSLWVYGIVASDGEVRPGRFPGQPGVATFTLTVSAVYDFQQTYPATGRARVSVYPDAYSERPSNLHAPGAAVRLRGRLTTPLPATNPGAFDYRAYLARRGVFSLLTVRRQGDIQATGAESTDMISRAALGLRNAVRRETAAHLRPEDAALLDGLLLSARTHLPADVEEAFAATGTVHILSVSGLHLSVLTAFLFLAFRWLRLPRIAANLLNIGLLWLFVLTAGASEAAVRSAVMASLILAAPLVRRTSDPLHSLAAAGAGILLVTPGALYEAGFQLSFVTTGAILLWMPPLKRLLLPREVGMNRGTLAVRYVLMALLVGIVAQFGSGPLVAYHFNRLSLIAPLANIPIAGLTELLLIGGLATAGVSPVLGPLAAPLWWLLSVGLGLLRILAFWFAAWPLASVSVVSPPVAALIVYYAIFGGVGFYVREIVLRKRLFAPSPPVPLDASSSGADPDDNGGLSRAPS
jgi:competence protein ComEC